MLGIVDESLSSLVQRVQMSTAGAATGDDDERFAAALWAAVEGEGIGPQHSSAFSTTASQGAAHVPFRILMVSSVTCS